MLAPWIGGASATSATNGGYRSLLAFWSGGAFGYDVVVPPVAQPSGGGFSHKHPQICVITIDGQDYRVRLENVQSFLERQKRNVETPKVAKSKKARKALAKNNPPIIVVKSAPPEYRMQIQASVDRSNEILRKIWEGNLTRLINEAEQEEALAIVLMMEDF